MRLRKMLDHINAELPHLSFKVASFTDNEKKIQNIHLLRTHLLKIREVPPLRTYVDECITLLPSFDHNESVRVPNHLAENLTTSFNSLVRSARLLSSALTGVFEGDEKEGTVYFKVPPTKDLETVANLIDELDKNFKLIFHRQENEGIYTQFNGFEKGSDWLSLLIVPATKIAMFLGVVKSILVISEKVLELEKRNLELEEYTEDKNIRDQYRKIHSDLIGNVLKSQVDKICKEISLNPDDPQNNEKLIQITKAAKALSTTFAKGVEVEVPLITAKKQTDERIVPEITKISESIGTQAQNILLPSPKGSEEN